jgi:GNAT superfamily N-acetyltransferase
MDLIAMTTSVKIRQVDPRCSPAAQQLIAELDRELLQRYPGDSVHTLDLSKITSDSGVFLVGYLDGSPVACGAVHKLEPGVGEIKRVFVIPAARGRGFSKLILHRLEQISLQLGFSTLRLESGTRQPEANQLYRWAGYYDIPKFGEYIDDPFSICMEKVLTTSP